MKDQTIDGYVIMTDPQPSDPGPEHPEHGRYRRFAFGATLDDAIGNYNDDSQTIGYVGVSRAQQNGRAFPFAFTTASDLDAVVATRVGPIIVVKPEEPDDEDEDDEIGAAGAAFP